MPLYFQPLFYTRSLALTLPAEVRVNFALYQFSFINNFLPQFECSLLCPASLETLTDFSVGVGGTCSLLYDKPKDIVICGQLLFFIINIQGIGHRFLREGNVIANMVAKGIRLNEIIWKGLAHYAQYRFI